jgi:hypothetical protein
MSRVKGHLRVAFVMRVSLDGFGQGKAVPPEDGFPSDPDGLLYLDKSSAKDACYACQPGSQQSDGRRIANDTSAIKRPIPFLLFWGGFRGSTSERNSLV